LMNAARLKGVIAIPQVCHCDVYATMAREEWHAA
jgi:hypothetical protein